MMCDMQVYTLEIKSRQDTLGVPQMTRGSVLDWDEMGLLAVVSMDCM